MYMCKECGQPCGKIGTCFKCLYELYPETDSIIIKDSTIKLMMKEE